MSQDQYDYLQKQINDIHIALNANLEVHESKINSDIIINEQFKALSEYVTENNNTYTSLFKQLTEGMQKMSKTIIEMNNEIEELKRKV